MQSHGMLNFIKSSSMHKYLCPVDWMLLTIWSLDWDGVVTLTGIGEEKKHVELAAITQFPEMQFYLC
jgi:hypothetical protein